MPGIEAVSNQNKNGEDVVDVKNSDVLDMTGVSDGDPSDTPVMMSNRFECRSCGYVYDPEEGVKKLAIARNTSFDDLDPNVFRCPVCRARKEAFRDIGSKDKPSGFEENLNYGFGVNSLTPGQKNVLIFGGLAFAVACFLSLYSLH